MNTEQFRLDEVAQYAKEYQSPDYKMGKQRLEDVQRLMRMAPAGSLLDVGTGRGETLQIAKTLGFSPVAGTEAVPYLAQGDVVHALAHNLPFPDNSYDVVTCFDVMEHLIEDDLIPAVREMARVAIGTIIISASEIPSAWRGRELHISRRPAKEWHDLIQRAAPDWTIERKGTAGGSPVFWLTR